MKTRVSLKYFVDDCRLPEVSKNVAFGVGSGNRQGSKQKSAHNHI